MARNTQGGNRFRRAAAHDYTVKDLPKNRLELFWVSFKGHFGSLFLLNILYVVFCLPLWAWLLYNLVTISESGYEQFVSDGLMLILLAVLIPCIAVTGPAKAAVKYVARNWARDEHASVFTDFVDAFKDNWKQGLFFSTLNGVLVFLVGIAIAFYGGLANQTLGLFMQYFLIMLAALWCMLNLYLWPMMVTYDMRIVDLLRNSFILLLGQLPRSILFGLITLVPLAIGLAFLPALLYYAIFGLAITAFINVSYTNYIFDIYFTPQIVGEVADRGMYKDDDEDWDDDK